MSSGGSTCGSHNHDGCQHDNTDNESIELYIANRDNEERDFFDEVADIEQQYIQQGFSEGCYAALQQSQQQGLSLGFEYGQDMGEELGFYRGFYLSFLMDLCLTATTITNNTSSSPSNSPTPLPAYEPNLTTNYTTPVSLDDIKDYNKSYFTTQLLTNDANKTALCTQLGFSATKYTSIITECINLLSLSQFVCCIPGEDGDVHHITDLRAKTKAIFARLGVANVFKDQQIIDF